MSLNEMMKEYAEYKRIIDAAKKEKDALEIEIKKALRALPDMAYNGIEHKAKLTVFDRVTIDTKALKKDFPEIYSEYGKVSVSERFSFQQEEAADMILLIVVIAILFAMMSSFKDFIKKYTK